MESEVWEFVHWFMLYLFRRWSCFPQAFPQPTPQLFHLLFLNTSYFSGASVGTLWSASSKSKSFGSWFRSAPFSRMRSEGFPFIVGGVGVGPVFAWLASSRRLSSLVVACRRHRVSNLLPLGEAFASDFAWTCHVSVCAAIPL